MLSITWNQHVPDDTAEVVRGNARGELSWQPVFSQHGTTVCLILEPGTEYGWVRATASAFTSSLEFKSQTNTHASSNGIYKSAQLTVNLLNVALVWPAATYSYESWTLRKSAETRLDAFETKGRRKDSAGFADSKENKWVHGFLTKLE